MHASPLTIVENAPLQPELLGELIAADRLPVVKQFLAFPFRFADVSAEQNLLFNTLHQCMRLRPNPHLHAGRQPRLVGYLKLAYSEPEAVEEVLFECKPVPLQQELVGATAVAEEDLLSCFHSEGGSNSQSVSEGGRDRRLTEVAYGVSVVTAK